MVAEGSNLTTRLLSSRESEKKSCEAGEGVAGSRILGIGLAGARGQGIASA